MNTGLIITAIAAVIVTTVIVADRARVRRASRYERLARLLDEQLGPVSESLQHVIERSTAARRGNIGEPELSSNLEALLERIAAEGGALAAFRLLSAEISPDLAARRFTLPPRRGTYEAELEREVARARRTGRSFSLVLLDVENPTGEHLLECAALLSRATRTTDVVCRCRRELFGILLPETTVDGASQFHRRLREEAAVAPDGPRELTFSTGIVEWWPGESSESLDSRARAAVTRTTGNGAAGRSQGSRQPG